MKNRIITLVCLFLSLIANVHAAKNFLQAMSKKELKKYKPADMKKAYQSGNLALDALGKNEESPLISAIQLKRFDLAKQLIKLKADFTVKDKQKRTIFDLIIKEISLINWYIYDTKKEIERLKKTNNYQEEEQELKNLEKQEDTCLSLVINLSKQPGIEITEAGVEFISQIDSELTKESKEIIQTIICQGTIDTDLINKEIKYYDKKSNKSKSTSLLHWTVEQNMAKAAAALIAKGADLNMVDSLNKTALGYAMIDLHPNNSADKENAAEKSAFMKKFISNLKKKNQDQIKLINSEILLEIKGTKKIQKTFLQWAVEELQEDICKLLIEKGADVGRKIDDKIVLWDFLENSENYNHEDKDENLKFWNIVFLLWQGHEASYKPEDIPLSVAISSIQALPTVTDEATLSVKENFEKMIKVFINKIDIQDKKNKKILASAIIVRSYLKNQIQFKQWTSVLEELIDKDGLNLNENMPLHKLIVAFKGLSKEKWFNQSHASDLVQVITKLLKKKPDLSVENNSKQNPLHYAVSLCEKFLTGQYKDSYLKIIQMLVEHGSPIQDALRYLLDQQALQKSPDDIKNQLYDAMKVIIQSVLLNAKQVNSSQMNELKEADISSYIITYAANRKDSDLLMLLHQHSFNFNDAKIEKLEFLENFKIEQDSQKEAQEKAAEEKAKKEAEEKAKKEAEEKAKKAAEEKAKKEAKLKAEKEAKEKAEQEKLAKEKAEQEAKLKAEQEAKEKAEKEAKEKAEQEKLAKEKAAKKKAKKEAKEKAEKEAKENKKSSELESTLKTLKDKLKGLKEKLKKLRGQMTKLKGALAPSVT